MKVKTKEISKLPVTSEWVNRIFSFKNQKWPEFDEESRNTGNKKLRSMETKFADMCITTKILLKLRIRSRPILKMPLIFNFILSDNIEEDLKLEKLLLNYQFKIICNPPFILFKKKISYENNLQLKFFFLNNDFMP